MKKFFIRLNSSVEFVVNANEYNLPPKTNLLRPVVNGVESYGASTSGPGKTVAGPDGKKPNNYYLYFKDSDSGKTLYYFKVGAPGSALTGLEAIEAARKGFEVSENPFPPTPAEIESDRVREEAEALRETEIALAEATAVEAPPTPGAVEEIAPVEPRKTRRERRREAA